MIEGVTGDADSAPEASHHSFDEAGLQMHDEHPQEGHLLARVLEDDPRVVRLAAQAVGRHHHGQVVHIHFSYRHVGWLSENLERIRRKQGVSSNWLSTQIFIFK